MKSIADVISRAVAKPADLNAKIEAAAEPCKPDCAICGGTGWLRPNLPVGHPEFGKLIMCPNGDLLRLPNAERYGLTQEETHALDWSDMLDRGNILRAVQAIQLALERQYGWVYLWGDFGQGKTLALKIAVAHTLRNRRFAAYVRMTTVVENLRAAFDAQDPSAEAERRLEWWTDLPVLAIDEVDRLRQTAYAAEQQFLLLDRRYKQALRQRAVTLLAANIPPDQLPGYLADRVLDGRFAIVRLAGASARLGMDWDVKG